MFDRTQHQLNVEAFMSFAQQDIPPAPVVPDESIRVLRAKLILEEALETIRGLGLDVMLPIDVCDVGDDGVKIYADDVQFMRGPMPNLAEIVDGCCDLKVVTTGTLSACGIPDDEFQEAVDQNNLAKFGPGGYRRPDGKWVKPPNHKPPDIAGLLEQLRRERCQPQAEHGKKS